MTRLGLMANYNDSERFLNNHIVRHRSFKRDYGEVLFAGVCGSRPSLRVLRSVG